MQIGYLVENAKACIEDVLNSYLGVLCRIEGVHLERALSITYLKLYANDTQTVLVCMILCGIRTKNGISGLLVVG